MADIKTTPRGHWQNGWGSPLLIDSAVLWYPDFTEPQDEQPRLAIELSHVRAADDIHVSYDGTRDGWVIERGIEDDDAPDDAPLRYREVAFIPSWDDDNDPDPEGA